MVRKLKDTSGNASGFTMVELLVALSIASILGTLSINLTTVMRARAADAQAMSANANLGIALSDFFQKFTEGMPSSVCNGADGAFYKKSGSTTLLQLNDAPFASAMAATGAKRPETIYLPGKDVGYIAEIDTGVTDDAQIVVYTWNCKGSRMHIRAYSTTCGARTTPFPDFEADYPLPADCQNYPPY